MTVTPHAWTRVKAIFDAAVVLDSERRAACVAELCGADGILRQQVETLLAAHEQADTFLDAPAASIIDRQASKLTGRTAGS
jgi:hypothetical protein